ncbi:TPA: DUF551 domain-containing protein [Escherichia coli]|nr:DUF551 domain-containing protein [Escherichia coli]
MTTITKERLLTIKQWRETYGPGSNVVLPAEEAEELARIALAAMEAEHVAWMCEDADGREYNACNEFSCGGRGIPLYATPQVQVVPEEMYWQDAPVEGSSKAGAYATDWNACREAMLQSQGEGNPHATPTRLPGGFTIEDAKALHEDLVRSHISKVLSGEKMKKKDRDADLRWIHDVIVQAAWFVKASLEQTALSGTPPVTTDGWISCSERMPNTKTAVLVAVEFDRKGDWRMKWATYIPGHPDANDGWIIPGASWKPSHWMPLPEPPQEVNP